MIRIIRRPEGEAPEWVRDAWIGLEIPLACEDQITTTGFGVVSGPRSFIGEWLAVMFGRPKQLRGWCVSADEAVSLLGARRPDAAAWWRREAPHMLGRKRAFLFDAPACEKL